MRVETRKGATTLQDISYVRTSTGRISSTMHAGRPEDSWNYTYDTLDRLLTANNGAYDHAIGAWAGHDGYLTAYWPGSGWTFYPIAYDVASNTPMVNPTAGYMYRMGPSPTGAWAPYAGYDYAFAGSGGTWVAFFKLIVTAPQRQVPTSPVSYPWLYKIMPVGPDPNGSGTGALSQTFTYDAAHNMTSNSAVGGYTYPTQGIGAVRPRAAIQAGPFALQHDGSFLARLRQDGQPDPQARLDGRAPHPATFQPQLGARVPAQVRTPRPARDLNGN